MNANAPAERQQIDAANFRFDTRNIKWKDFITKGCYYRILDVNVAAHTVDMLVKFDPGCECLWHRHVAATTSLVLEGSLWVMEQTANGAVEKIRPAGSFEVGRENEVHIEGGGEQGGLGYFSMRGKDDRIYDLLNPDLSLRRAVSVQDFARDWEYWTKA